MNLLGICVRYDEYFAVYYCTTVLPFLSSICHNFLQALSRLTQTITMASNDNLYMVGSGNIAICVCIMLR